MNGGSTFLIRVVEHRRKQNLGSTIVYWGKVDPEIFQALSKSASLFHINNLVPKFLKFLPSELLIFANLRLPNTEGAKNIHIHSFGIFSLISAWNVVKDSSNYFVSTGVYHQHEFLYKYPAYDIFTGRFREIFKRLHPKQIIFFNEFSKQHYASTLNTTWRTSEIVPIGVEIKQKKRAHAPLKSKRKIITIVGNLEAFKSYIIHTVKILKQLVHEHPDVLLQIWGDGPLRTQIQKIVDNLNLQNHVQLRGRLEYAKLYDTLDQTYVFIGGGTAIIEASAYGVPSIVGIENTYDPITYGFFSEIFGYDYNEFDANKPTFSLKDKLIHVLNSDETSYTLTAERCYLKAMEFSIEKTAAFFVDLPDNQPKTTPLINIFPMKERIIMAIGLSIIFLFDRLGISKHFSRRRDGGQ